MFWLTEDSLYAFALEDSARFLQEFLGEAAQIDSTGVVTVSISTVRSTSASISATGQLNQLALRGVILPSVSVSSTGRVSSLVTRAKPRTAKIQATGRVSVSLAVIRNTSAIIIARGAVQAKANTTVLVDVTISGVGIVDVSTQTLIPQPHTNFRVVRSADTAALTWAVGADTYRTDIYRSPSQRAAMVKVGESFGQSYSDSGLLVDTNYAYQIVPIGVSGRKGKASYRVYTSSSNNRL